MNSDPHAPHVTELTRREDWAALVRYWMAHSRHAPAFDAACRIAQAKASHPRDRWAILADFLDKVRGSPFERHNNLPEQFQEAWNPVEAVILLLLQLFPQIALCELAAKAPKEKRDRFFRAGIEAVEFAAVVASVPTDSALVASFHALKARAHQEMNQLQAARASCEEALGIRRELAGQRPEVYWPDVAMTLNNLGTVQRALNTLEAARASYEEALGIRRELARQRPEVYRPNVAMTLHNLGDVQRALNDLEVARASYEEALEIRRELAGQLPEVYRPDVATTLNNLGDVQRALNDLEGARASFEEANDQYDADAARNPLARLVERMRCRDNLGRLLLRESSAPGKPDYALACEKFRQARAIFEQFRARFASAEERKRVLREAADIYERLLQTCVDLWDVEGGGLHHLQEAVEVAEASRSRHLIDLLAHEALDPRFAPAHLVGAFRELRRRLGQLERRLMEQDSGGPMGVLGSEGGLTLAVAGMRMARLSMQRPETLAAAPPTRTDADDDQLAKRLAERDELNRQHATLLAQIRQHDPEFDPDQPVAPVSFAQAQALLPTDVPTAIVQFTLTREKGLALVITGNDILKVSLPDFAERQGWELADEWLRNYYEGRNGDTAAWMRHWEQVLPGLARCCRESPPARGGSNPGTWLAAFDPGAAPRAASLSVPRLSAGGRLIADGLLRDRLCPEPVVAAPVRRTPSARTRAVVARAEPDWTSAATG